MRLHRFFLNKPIEGENLIVSDLQLIHQWRDVFRYNVGSEVILFDGSQFEFDAVIESLNNREATLAIISKRKGVVLEREINLYFSLVKKDNSEFIVEKATELGVSKIVPLISERSEKKGFNLERARRIAVEASEQCGRADVPEIGEVMGLVECIKYYGKDAIVFDPSGDPLPYPIIQNTSPINIFIGPEGGWSPKELEIFKNKNAQVYSFGNLVLRTETAAITALAKLI